MTRKTATKKNVGKKKTPKTAETRPTQDTLSSKDQKLFDNLLRVTYEFVKGKNYIPLSKQSLIDRLKIHEEHLHIFGRVLDNLGESGKLHYHEEKYHARAEPQLTRPQGLQRARGNLSVHPRGFGFLNMSGQTEDIFIPKQYMNGAVDGDLVEVEYDITKASEKGPDGKVVTILERGRKELAGTVTHIFDNIAFVYSSLLGETNLCRCPLPKKGKKIQKGQRVLVEIASWGPKKEPEACRIKEVIGNIEDPLSDIPFAIAANSIRAEFSKQALEEAGQFGTRVSQKDLKGRRDLRDLECFTIDPDTAKDFDDAVSLKKIGKRYQLGVHIADVSHYVTPNSLLDREAALRCNSTYFPGTCIPMLPHELSENLCSLKPNVNRLVVSVFIDIDEDGTTVGWDIARSVIKSQKRFTYKEAKKVLDGTKSSKHKKTLLLMLELCALLQKERARRGSVQLSMPELVLKIDASGVPVGTEIVEYDITHQVIEEFMLKANEVVAIHLHKQGRDITYRVHEEPAEESLKDFSSLVRAFGFSLPDVPTAHDIQKFFLEIQDDPHATKHLPYLATSYIKSMRLACYSPDNIGHYGLSLEHYCHFTSPIRRYVDTLVHRLLFENPISKNELSDICLKASERERISARAEGFVLQIKKLRYLQKLREQDQKRQYRAIVSRVKPYGIYFDLPEIMMDGFLHISELEDDYFLFDDNSNTLNGRYHGISYRAGDEILVMVQSVDLITAASLWHMVCKVDETESATPVAAPHKKSKKRDRKRVCG